VYPNAQLFPQPSYVKKAFSGLIQSFSDLLFKIELITLGSVSTSIAHAFPLSSLLKSKSYSSSDSASNQFQSTSAT